MDKEAINKRFLDVISYLLSSKTVESKGKLANTLGIKATKFSEILNNRMSIGTDLAALICVEYEVCPDWLLTGRGSMLRTEQAHPIPLPVVQADSSGEAAIYYKMYKEEKEGKEALIAENATLKERLRQLEAPPVKEPAHPPLIEKVVDAFTPDSLGGSGKDFIHARNPTSSKTLSVSKT